MNLKQRVMCMFSAITLMTPVASASYLPDKDYQDGDNISIVISQEDLRSENKNIKIKPLTTEEFQQRYKEITGKETIVPFGNYSTSEITYVDEDLLDMGYGIEVGCLIRVACGQSCSWVEVVEDSAYAIAVGNGSYTWDTAYAHATMQQNGSKKQLELRARGTIEVAINRSVSNGGTIGVGLDFINSNYTFSNTIGSTDYFRKTDSISHLIYEK